MDIELSVEGVPFDPPTKGDECTATSQLANHDPTVRSQRILSLIVSYLIYNLVAINDQQPLQ